MSQTSAKSTEDSVLPANELEMLSSLFPVHIQGFLVLHLAVGT
jgi:hypothetical protein